MMENLNSVNLNNKYVTPVSEMKCLDCYHGSLWLQGSLIYNGITTCGERRYIPLYPIIKIHRVSRCPLSQGFKYTECYKQISIILDRGIGEMDIPVIALPSALLGSMALLIGSLEGVIVTDTGN